MTVKIQQFQLSKKQSNTHCKSTARYVLWARPLIKSWKHW